MRLCSWPCEDDALYPVCDLPQGHTGPHRATIYWGDEVYDDDGTDGS